MSDIKLYWFKAYQNKNDLDELDCVRSVNEYCGLSEKPNYVDVEKFDLRAVDYCSMDELEVRYLRRKHYGVHGIKQSN